MQGAEAFFSLTMQDPQEKDGAQPHRTVDCSFLWGCALLFAALTPIFWFAVTCQHVLDHDTRNMVPDYLRVLK